VLTGSDPSRPKGPPFAHMDGDARAFAWGQLLDTICVSGLRSERSGQIRQSHGPQALLNRDPQSPTKNGAAYRKVLRLCSQESLPGEIMAIMHVLARGLIKLSRRTCEGGGRINCQGQPRKRPWSLFVRKGPNQVPQPQRRFKTTYLRQFRRAKGRVGALSSKGPDALLESKQAFVDFCSLHAVEEHTKGIERTRPTRTFNAVRRSIEHATFISILQPAHRVRRSALAVSAPRSFPAKSIKENLP
jgi:hypothetical protein